jgi:hypothetical protein
MTLSLLLLPMAAAAARDMARAGGSIHGRHGRCPASRRAPAEQHGRMDDVGSADKVREQVSVL